MVYDIVFCWFRSLLPLTFLPCYLSQVPPEFKEILDDTVVSALSHSSVHVSILANMYKLVLQLLWGIFLCFEFVFSVKEPCKSRNSATSSL